MAEPLSEDDCPEDVRVMSFSFEQEGKKTFRNYIREGDQDARPLNVLIEEENDGNGSNDKGAGV